MRIAMKPKRAKGKTQYTGRLRKLGTGHVLLILGYFQ